MGNTGNGGGKDDTGTNKRNPLDLKSFATVSTITDDSNDETPKNDISDPSEALSAAADTGGPTMYQVAMVMEGGEGGERKSGGGDAPAEGDSPEKKKLADYDKRLPEALKNLDASIAKLTTAQTPALETLRNSQVDAVNLIDSIGKERNARGESPTVTDSENQLEQRFKAVGQQVDAQLESPAKTKLRDLQILKGCLLISSGTDENVKAGEKQLAEMVRDNPSLSVDDKFRESVLRAYTEMTAKRQLRGLGDWKSDLKVDDILPAKGTAGDGKSVGELMKTASEVYFEKGIKDALPLFDKAVDRNTFDRNTAERERLGLFIQGLGQNANIARETAKGADTQVLVDEIADTQVKEKAAWDKSIKTMRETTSLTVNRAFAKIASGDPQLTTQGKIEIAKALEDNPATLFNKEFNEAARNAFAQNHAGRAPDQVADAGKGDAGKGDAGKTAPQEPPAPAAPQNLDFTKDYENESDTKIKPYAVDQVTTVALFVGVTGLGLLSTAKTISKIREARATRAAAELAHEVKPLQGAEPAKYSMNNQEYEVKGQTSDGRVILKDTAAPGTTTGGAEPENLTSLKPKGFDPVKGKFLDYTPMKIDGEKFYAAKDGTVYAADGRYGLKETAQSRQYKVQDMGKYGNSAVNQAFDQMPFESQARLVRDGSPSTRNGGYWEMAGNVGPAEAESLSTAIRDLEWKPYNPVDATGMPLVEPPARMFQADMSGGRMDSASLEGLPADTKFSLVDRNGTGDWVLVTEQSGVKGDKADFATIVLEPEIGQDGKPTGKEVVRSFKPGDPQAPAVSLKDVDVQERHRKLNVDGKGIEGFEIPEREQGKPRRIEGLTREQAMGLGYRSAAVETPTFDKLPVATQVESVRDLAQRIESGETAPARSSREHVDNKELSKLLRETATTIEEFDPAKTSLDTLKRLKGELSEASMNLFIEGRMEEVVAVREIHDRTERMQREAIAEQFKSNPIQALIRQNAGYASFSDMIATGNENSLANRPPATEEGKRVAREMINESRSTQAGLLRANEILQERSDAGKLPFTKEACGQAAEAIAAEALKESDPRKAEMMLTVAKRVKGFSESGELTVDSVDLKYDKTGNLEKVVDRAGESFAPGRIEIKDGHLSASGDLESVLRRNPKQIFEIAKGLANGEIKSFDLEFAAGVTKAADSMKTLTPQELFDGFNEVLRAEKQATLEGKSPNGLRLLWAAGITGGDKEGVSGRANNTGASNYRPGYPSTDNGTAVDKAWKGLEGSTNSVNEADRIWTSDAVSRWKSGVALAADGTVVGIGDVKGWLKENPSRVFDVVNLLSDPRAESMHLDLHTSISNMAEDLKASDRSKLYDGLMATLDPARGESAEKALSHLKSTKLAETLFPKGDFSSPEKARQWLANERVREALNATPNPYVDNMVRSNVAEGRSGGAYWESVDGKPATQEALLKALRNADVRPVNPVDASGRPLVKPPARAYQADIPGGVSDTIGLDALPPDAKLSLVDSGDGKWSLVVNDSSIKGQPTEKCTFIVGPAPNSQGKPSGKEMIWAIKAGDANGPGSVDSNALAKAKGLPDVRDLQSEPGKPRRIDGVTIEQARALGLDTARTTNTKLTDLDRVGQARRLEDVASRMAPGAGPETQEAKDAKLLKDTAKALREYGPNSTQGNDLLQMQNDLKSAAERATAEGRSTDAVLFNEAREAVTPLAARSQVNTLLAELHKDVDTKVEAEFGHNRVKPAKTFSSPEDLVSSLTQALEQWQVERAAEAEFRSQHSVPQRIIEAALNDGGFPQNSFGYDTLRKLMDARAQLAHTRGEDAKPWERASAVLREVAENMPQATGTSTEPGAASALKGELKNANNITIPIEGVDVEEQKSRHTKGSERAVNLVAEAERNPLNPRNSATYGLLSQIIKVQAADRELQASKMVNGGDRTRAMKEAAGEAEVADVVTNLARGVNAVDVQNTHDIFAAAIEAGAGAEVSEGRMQQLARHATRIGELSQEQLRNGLTEVLLKSESPGRSLEFLQETGALKRILPELAALDGLHGDVRSNPETNTFKQVAAALDRASTIQGLEPQQREALMWATLLKDVGKVDAQRITAVDGESPRVEFGNHSQGGADMCDRIMDRMQVPQESRPLIKALVAEGASLEAGLSDARVEELIRKHDGDFKVFTALQEAGATARGVHTPEQFERLKLAEIGLNPPVAEDGRVLTPDEYWKNDAIKNEAQAQETRVRDASYDRGLRENIRHHLNQSLGLQETKIEQVLDKVVEQVKKAELKTVDDLVDWLREPANYESVGLRRMTVGQLPNGQSVDAWVKENPMRFFEVAANVSNQGAFGVDRASATALYQSRDAVRVLSAEQLSQGLKNCMNSADPQVALNVLNSTGIIKSMPPAEAYATAESRNAWADKVAHETLTRSRALAGGLGAAKNLAEEVYKFPQPLDYAKDKGRVLTVLERADKLYTENGYTANSSDRAVFKSTVDAYKKGEAWAINLVHENLNSIQWRSSRPADLSGVPESITATEAGAYLKENPKLHKASVYEAYVRSAEPGQEGLRKGVIAGLKYLEANPNAKPEWKQPGAFAQNADARSMEYDIKKATGATDGNVAEVLNEIEAIQKQGFAKFAEGVEAKTELKVPTESLAEQARLQKEAVFEIKNYLQTEYAGHSLEAARSLDARLKMDKITRILNDIDGKNGRANQIEAYRDVMSYADRLARYGKEAGFDTAIQEHDAFVLPKLKPRIELTDDMKPGVEALAKLKAGDAGLADRVDKVLEQLQALEKSKQTTERIKWSMSAEGGEFLSSAEGLEKLERLVTDAAAAPPAEGGPRAGQPEATTAGGREVNVALEEGGQSRVLEGEKRTTDTATPVEVAADLQKVKLPGGLEIFVDRKMEKAVGKYIEKYSQEGNFKELLADRLKRQQEKIDKEKNSETKAKLVEDMRAMETDIAKYHAMPEAEKIAYRDLVLGEAMNRYSARMSGRYKIAAAVGAAGTVILIGMVAEHALDLIPNQAPVEPTPVKPKIGTDDDNKSK